MKKILLLVLDGFGFREETEGNAVKLASTPNFDSLWEKYPHSLLEASGSHVGLPAGQFGNSEVGHMALGSGRIIKQKETIVDELFLDDRLNRLALYVDTINYLKDSKKSAHLMMLASDGGVHSHIKHLIKMLEKLKESGIEKVYLHLITDGRDTSTHASYKYIEMINKAIDRLGIGTIASICGRFYAMDRDNKWERTQKYYDLVVRGVGIKNNNIMKTIQACYVKDITDEFIPPILFDENGLIRNGDVLFWLNFRPDRARQILSALSTPNFNQFPRPKLNIKILTLYPVDNSVIYDNFIDNIVITNPLGLYLSDLGLTQARVAETEKFAHVTNFFDGENPQTENNCDRFLIPSPKVETYDLKPEMSAIEVCKKCVSCMEKDYDFILTNFANPDMVGHTGDLDATVKAVQVVDLCLGKIIEAAQNNFYTIFLLADHGNADIMIDENGNPVTTHTSSPVPFIVTDNKVKIYNGGISSVAPTILEYMDISIPKEMTSPTLFKETEHNIEKIDFEILN